MLVINYEWFELIKTTSRCLVFLKTYKEIIVIVVKIIKIKQYKVQTF